MLLGGALFFRGVAHLGLIIPLGGTTLFFRRPILEKLCGWDAHNVTEDADLGVRLARHGYRTDLLPTVTYEKPTFAHGPGSKQRVALAERLLDHMGRTQPRARSSWIRDVGLIRFLGVQTLFLATFCQFIFAPISLDLLPSAFRCSHILVETTLGPEAFYSLFGFFVFCRNP